MMLNCLDTKLLTLEQRSALEFFGIFHMFSWMNNHMTMQDGDNISAI